jgi:quinol monooxygenase YgiN
MLIYQTAHYQVRDDGVPAVVAAIKEFVDYVTTSEPGTIMYTAWQQKDDPTRFVHLFTFQDEQAHARHGSSDAVRRFEGVYRPVLEGGPVLFTDYELIASNQHS